MAGEGNRDGVNDPLPRMSREDAEEWAGHWIDSMARTAGATVDAESRRPRFLECVGENDEVAEDGRFRHHYSARASLEPERHAEAIQAIREALEERGFEIQAYRSGSSQNLENGLDAMHPEDHQLISAEDFDEEQLLLRVRTPCLLPPGVEQQQF